MKKFIIIIVLLFSTLFNGSLTSAATADYDHNELLDYPGYAEAMYQSIVEQTTFISGRYTENKDYVNQSINQVTDYAKGWWDEYLRISELPPKEKIREMVNAAGGYALTVGDFIKNLFNDYDVVENGGSSGIDYGGLESYFTLNGSSITIIPGYTFELRYSGKSKDNQTSLTIVNSGCSRCWISSSEIGGELYYVINNIEEIGKTTFPDDGGKLYTVEYNRRQNLKSSVSGYLSLAGQAGASIIIKKDGVPLDIQGPPPKNNNLRTINNYIKDGNVPQMVTPQPTAYLSCPDDTRINMAINGGTFLDINGQVMQVSKDGTATVDSQLCNLGWEKPTVQYVDGTDQVGISTPDEKIIDAETGETISDGEDIDFDDTLEGCDGVLCGIGKLLSGLASIAKSIAGLVGKILDGLLALFVPDNLDFVSGEFDKMSAKFTDKFSLLTGLKDTITGVFANSNTGNPLADVNMALPAAPGVNFSLDTITFIEPFVPRIKQILSGILFLMTIIYVYRKITGRGGVMEK